MAPTLLFDVSEIDLDAVVHDARAIERVNPHRGAMRLIDAVTYDNPEAMRFAAYHDAREDAFWAPGHIPGRPLMPGVLMVEAAAQLASFATLSYMEGIEFMGFARLDDVRFRAQVTPGQRLYILLQITDLRPRRSVGLFHGIVDGNLAFECKITGMPM